MHFWLPIVIRKNIRLEFIGDRNYKTVMHPNDVKAVAELSELARVLSAIEEIKKEQKEANLKIKVCETEDGREYGRINFVYIT